MKFEVADEKELQHYKDRAMMLKMLALDHMNKNVLSDVSTFSKRDKIKLQVEIETHWDDKDIVERFNELCIQTIFEDGKMDIEAMPVKESIGPVVPDEVKEYQQKWKEENKDKEGVIVN